MNYRRVYWKIISSAKEDKTRPSNRNIKHIGFEFHHILPKSLFPKWSEKSSNIVALTYREHFLVHLLLQKIYPSYEMSVSFLLMSNYSRFNSRLYQLVKSKFFFKYREQLSENAIKGWSNMSEQTRSQFKEQRRRCALFLWQDETYRQKVIEGRLDYFQNRTCSQREITNSKISQSLKEYFLEETEEHRLKRIESITKSKQCVSSSTRKLMSLSKKNMTEEQKQEWIQRRNESLKNKTEEQKELSKHRRSLAAKESFSNFTEEKKREINSKRHNTWKDKDLSELRKQVSERNRLYSEAFHICRQIKEISWNEFRRMMKGVELSVESMILKFKGLI